MTICDEMSVRPPKSGNGEKDELMDVPLEVRLMAAVARDYSSPTAKHNIFPAAAMHTLVPRWVTRVISTERQSLPLLPQEPTFGCSTISVATALFASSIVQATGTGAGHVGTAAVSQPRRSCFETRIHRVAGKLSEAYIQKGTIIP